MPGGAVMPARNGRADAYFRDVRPQWESYRKPNGLAQTAINVLVKTNAPIASASEAARSIAPYGASFHRCSGSDRQQPGNNRHGLEADVCLAARRIHDPGSRYVHH
jgi:hypothetical protein